MRGRRVLAAVLAAVLIAIGLALASSCGRNEQQAAAYALWNCASSVEPLSASVELSPPETACATRSK
jgi:hypothetical protein